MAFRQSSERSGLGESKIMACGHSTPNNSFKPNPLRGSA